MDVMLQLGRSRSRVTATSQRYAPDHLRKLLPVFSRTTLEIVCLQQLHLSARSLAERPRVAATSA